jgi:hypothetical protein
MQGMAEDYISNCRTKLLIEDYISETTSALLYLFSLPSPNSKNTAFPRPPSFTPQITSTYLTTHNSPTLTKPRTSSSDLSVQSVPANLAPAAYSGITTAPTLSFQEKKSFFLQSRQTFGSTALVLQGGSVFGLCHVGVVRGLWKRGLLPRIIVGWGVGGVIASLGKSRSVLEILKKVCSQTDADMDNLLMSGGVDLSPLSHSEQGTRLRRLRRLFTEGHLFDVK